MNNQNVQLNQRVRELKQKLVSMVTTLADAADSIADESVSVSLRLASISGDEAMMTRSLKSAAVVFCASNYWKIFRHTVCVLEAFDDMRHAKNMKLFIGGLAYGERHAV